MYLLVHNRLFPDSIFLFSHLCSNKPIFNLYNFCCITYIKGENKTHDLKLLINMIGFASVVVISEPSCLKVKTEANINCTLDTDKIKKISTDQNS